MAATRIIEDEHGTFTGTPRNPHQGYYAGDFSRRPVAPSGFAPAPQYAAASVATTSTSGWF